MATFRIVLDVRGGIEPRALADALLAAHGDDYDAKLGDFTVGLDGDRVTVTVLKVGGGDVDALAADIAVAYEVGTFSLAVLQQQGDNWFYRDEGDDEL